MTGTRRGARILNLSDWENDADSFGELDGDDCAQPAFVHLRDRRLAKAGSVLSLARSSDLFREVVVGLARRGFFAYGRSDGDESRFVHRERLASLWQPAISGNVSVSSCGIFYELHRPSVQAQSLLVVFSGMSADPTSTAISRYFTRNYNHIAGYVPRGTAILRIADVGGVCGAFYMDLAEKPDNEESVRKLIETMRVSLGLEPNRVCLLGSSKGATAAVLHGIAGAWHFVAVDPVLGDLYYEKVLGDPHFTAGGVFRSTKEERFSQLLRSLKLEGGWRRLDRHAVFLTSPRSAQYGTVVSFFQELTRGQDGLLLVSEDQSIHSHPEVARAVLWATTAQVCRILSDWPFPNGVRRI